MPIVCKTYVLAVVAIFCKGASSRVSKKLGSGNMKIKNATAGPAQRSIYHPPTSRNTPATAGTNESISGTWFGKYVGASRNPKPAESKPTPAQRSTGFTGPKGSCRIHSKIAVKIGTNPPCEYLGLSQNCFAPR